MLPDGNTEQVCNYGRSSNSVDFEQILNATKLRCCQMRHVVAFDHHDAHHVRHMSTCHESASIPNLCRASATLSS